MFDMKPLEPPDRHHLMAAQGWLDLGNREEASLELERIAPELRFHPDVVKVRWRLYGRNENWHTVLRIARTICDLEPISDPVETPVSWPARRASLGSRKTPVLRSGGGPIGLPELFAIPYNLACYACQLGNVNEAWEWFKMALDMADASELRRIALNDPDLEPLWKRISKL